MKSVPKKRRSRLRVFLMLCLVLMGLDVALQSYLWLNLPWVSSVSILHHSQTNRNLQERWHDPSGIRSQSTDSEIPQGYFESLQHRIGKSLKLGSNVVDSVEDSAHLAEKGLVLTSITSTTYEIKLTVKPSDDVAITVHDVDGCFSRISPSGIVFSAGDTSPRLVSLTVDEKGIERRDACESGRVLHQVFSTDLGYDRLVVQAQPLLAFMSRFDSLKFNQRQIEENLHNNEPASQQPVVVKEEDKEEKNLKSHSIRGSSQVIPSPPRTELHVNNKTIATASREKKVVNTTSTNHTNNNHEEQSDFPSLKSLVSNISGLIEKYDCIPSKLANHAMRCTLAKGTEYSTWFYIVSAPNLVNRTTTPAPLVMITGGVHGRELAGFEAAKIIKTWTPRAGRLLVIDRMNRRGIERHTRYVPSSTSQQNKTVHDDLNRNFPDQVGDLPRTELSRMIWELCELVRPKLFLDLHEGWGFYSQLKQNEAPDSQHLVANPKFSKGSTVIASENALKMAKFMTDVMNEGIKDPKHLFVPLSPPIAGGLARRLFNAFHTQAFVLETTQLNQPVEKRVSQHLKMVSSLLAYIGFLPNDFEPAKPRLQRRP